MWFALRPVRRLAIRMEQTARPDVQRAATQVAPVDFVQCRRPSLCQLRLYEGKRRLDLGHFEDRGTRSFTGGRPGRKATSELPSLAVGRKGRKGRYPELGGNVEQPDDPAGLSRTQCRKQLASLACDRPARRHRSPPAAAPPPERNSVALDNLEDRPGSGLLPGATCRAPSAERPAQGQRPALVAASQANVCWNKRIAGSVAIGRNEPIHGSAGCAPQVGLVVGQPSGEIGIEQSADVVRGAGVRYIPLSFKLREEFQPFTQARGQCLSQRQPGATCTQAGRRRVSDIERICRGLRADERQAWCAW